MERVGSESKSIYDDPLPTRNDYVYSNPREMESKML